MGHCRSQGRSPGRSTDIGAYTKSGRGETTISTEFNNTGTVNVTTGMLALSSSQ
jgi:hypothetical protein